MPGPAAVAVDIPGRYSNEVQSAADIPGGKEGKGPPGEWKRAASPPGPSAARLAAWAAAKACTGGGGGGGGKWPDSSRVISRHLPHQAKESKSWNSSTNVTNLLTYAD